MTEEKNPTCYVCVQPGADTDDHLIPRALFLSPRPTNLVTLPAHHACHKSHSEDYARAILAGMSAGSPIAAKIMALYVRPSLLRSDLKGTKLRRDLIRTLIRRIELHSPEGLILGYAPGVQFDRARVYPMLTKIVRGLYYRHVGRFLPTGARFSWGLNEPLEGRQAAMFEQSAAGLSYTGTFECRYAVGSDATGEGSVWWLRFYEGVVFRCYVFIALPAV